MRSSLPVILGLLLTACSGPDLHQKLKPDTEVLVRQWTRPTHGLFLAGDRGFEYSNPVLADGTLLFGNQSVGLMALYPGLNELRWKFQVNGGVMSPLEIFENRVFFGGGDGFLYSLDVSTGALLWKYEIRTTVASQPTLHSGRLFVTGNDDTVYAFDAATGKWLWHYRRRSAQEATILTASRPIVNRNEVVVGMSDGFVIGLSLNDGQLLWQKKIHEGSKFIDVDSEAVVLDGVMYIPSYDGSLYALKRDDRTVLWRHESGGAKRVTLEGNRLFFPSSDSKIYALKKDSGQVLWKFEMDGGVPGQLVVTDRHIIVGSSYQYLYVIDKETGTGLYRWNAGYDSGFAGTPAVDLEKNRLYVLSGAGNLYSFMIQPPPRKTWKYGRTSAYEYSGTLKN